MVAVLCAAIGVPGIAHADCKEVLAALGNTVVDVTCAPSADLTTKNPTTTPADNSIPGLPPGAFTPTTDRGVISNGPAEITKAVPGLQINGRFADDPDKEARFLLRLPNDWNGSLVVAGASGTRSEFNGDFAWSDYVVQKGYAYASQNKGVLNLKITSLDSATPPTPLSCRLKPDSKIWVEFFDNDAVLEPRHIPSKPFTQWTQYLIEATGLAKQAVKARYNHFPRRTYAVGTSNGGYQVRRALETAPELFDGGVDWEGTFVDALGPNILIDLPPAIRNWPDYVASGFNPNSQAARNIVAAGYPPDMPGTPLTFWGRYWTQFWEVTQCQWQKRFDPAWTTYNDGPNDVTGTGGYTYYDRIVKDPSIAARVAAIATTGNIKRPLVTVAGTMDALLPIKHGARAYEALVAEHGRDRDAGGGRSPQYRLYEVQNGNHIEAYKTLFPDKLELIQPLAQNAFDRLVDHIENGALLPASQCIPRGKTTLADQPSQPGHCANLLVP